MCVCVCVCVCVSVCMCVCACALRDKSLRFGTRICALQILLLLLLLNPAERRQRQKEEEEETNCKKQTECSVQHRGEDRLKKSRQKGNTTALFSTARSRTKKWRRQATGTRTFCSEKKQNEEVEETSNRHKNILQREEVERRSGGDKQ